MKKKLVSLCAVVALAAVAVGGATLAYFTDTDSKDNAFTAGNLDITLNEVFDQDNAQLIPGKDIQKEITVTNTDGTDAYVRVHFAIPSNVDDGDPNFAAVNNFLHFNFTRDSFADGLWSWLPEFSEGAGYAGNGAGNWNFYTTKIDGVDYNVYVVTYRTALASGETTKHPAVSKVYMDTAVDSVSNADGSVTYTDDKGNELTLAKDATLLIKVVAEGAQAEGFDNAYDALNTAFGAPGTYNAFAAEQA